MNLQDGSEPLPTPLPWFARAAAMAWIPAKPDEACISRLRFILEEVGRTSVLDATVQWPDTGEETTIRSAVSRLLRSGLLVAPGRSGSVRLTDEAKRWLETGDNAYLLGVFHANIQFVGELLNEVNDRTTIDELRQAAVDKYGFAWKSRDQVRRRTTWLAAAGFIELWSSDSWVITEAGKRLRARLVSESAENLLYVKDRPSEVAIGEPRGEVASLLASVGQDDLQSRKMAFGYVPGGNYVDVIQRLVGIANPSVSRDGFIQRCSEAFRVAANSAYEVLLTLQAAKLVEQVGRHSFAVTALGREWLESADPIDLMRILHASFFGVGETLRALEDVETSGDLNRYLQDMYSVKEMRRHEVAIRLRFLRDAGLVDRISFTRHRLNGQGRALYRSLPLQEPQKTPTDLGVLPEGSERGEPSSRDTTERIRAAKELAIELAEAAVDSKNYQRLEHAVANVARFLGFEAEEHPETSRTDVLVRVWLGPGETRRYVVDAKTAASGIREEGSVQFEVLEGHKRDEQADQVAVVGPNFGGRLPQWASERGVALVKTDELGTWLVRHAQSPLPAKVLASLFDTGQPGLLRESWDATLRKQDVVSRVMGQLWESAHSDMYVRRKKGALSTGDLWLLLSRTDPALDETEIEAALALLGSDLVGAVKPQGDGYVAVQGPSDVAARLCSIAVAIEEANGV